MDPNVVWSTATNPTNDVAVRQDAIVGLHEHVTQGGALPDGIDRRAIVAQRVTITRLTYSGSRT